MIFLIKREFLRLNIFTGNHCLSITIQETHGTHDDGIVNRGNTFSIYCSVPEITAGKYAMWYVLPEMPKYSPGLVD